MKTGFIYGMVNTVAPGITKVGKSVDAHRRVREHNQHLRSSSDIGEWKLAFCFEVADMDQAEKAMPIWRHLQQSHD